MNDDIPLTKKYNFGKAYNKETFKFLVLFRTAFWWQSHQLDDVQNVWHNWENEDEYEG
jgi:hypothetical protein